MHDDLDSFTTRWRGFLPANAVIMARPSSRPAVSGQEQERALSFQFEVPGINLPGHRSLLEKILSALELSPGAYSVHENFAERSEPETPALIRIRLVLDPEAKRSAEGGTSGIEEWSRTRENADGSWILTTYSLAAMIEDPSLKKKVWTSLKEALARARGMK